MRPLDRQNTQTMKLYRREKNEGRRPTHYGSLDHFGDYGGFGVGGSRHMTTTWKLLAIADEIDEALKELPKKGPYFEAATEYLKKARLNVLHTINMLVEARKG